MCDSKGVISTRRTDLNNRRRICHSQAVNTLAEALVERMCSSGLSVADVMTQDMVRSMSENPIVFALANPRSRFPYKEAIASRGTIIFATGRSDYPNQINNVLSPYIFRGALDVHARLSMRRWLAAVKAIADLAKEPVPDVVNAAYKLKAYHLRTTRLYPSQHSIRVCSPPSPWQLPRLPLPVAWPRKEMRTGKINQPA